MGDDAGCPISVVIPARGRPAAVGQLLASLEAARRSHPGPSEVLVVDASPGDDAHRVRAATLQRGARYIRAGGGPGAQRNAGWRAAHHPIVHFLDSDCLATPRLLAASAVARDHAIAGRVVFGGRPSTWLRAALWTGVAAGFDGLGARTRQDIAWASAANLALPRKMLEELDGFDELLPAGEDVDLCLRLRKRGHRLLYVPDAVVVHSPATWSGLGVQARRFFEYGRADAWLAVRHRELAGSPEPELASMTLALTAAALWRSLRRRSAAPLAAVPLALLAAGAVFAATSPPPRGARSLGRLLMEALHAGRAFEACRSRTWSALLHPAQLDPDQRRREAAAIRSARAAALVAAVTAVLA